MPGIHTFSHLPDNPILDYTWDECFEILQMEEPEPGTDVSVWRWYVLKPHYKELIRGEHDPRARRVFELLNLYYEGKKLPAPPPQPPMTGNRFRLKAVEGIEHRELMQYQDALQVEPKVRGDGKAAIFHFTVMGAVIEVRGLKAARTFRRLLRSRGVDFTMELQ